MPAHAEIADVVEEDHRGRRRWIDGRHKKCADEHSRSTRLVDDRSAVAIKLPAEDLTTLGQRSAAQFRATIYDHARRLAAGVRVDDGDPLAHLGRVAMALRMIARICSRSCPTSGKRGGLVSSLP